MYNVACRCCVLYTMLYRHGIVGPAVYCALQAQVEIRQTIITCKKIGPNFFIKFVFRGSPLPIFLFRFSPPPVQHWRSHTTAGVGMGLTEKFSPPPSICYLVMGGGGIGKNSVFRKGEVLQRQRQKVSHPCWRFPVLARENQIVHEMRANEMLET